MYFRTRSLGQMRFRCNLFESTSRRCQRSGDPDSRWVPLAATILCGGRSDLGAGADHFGFMFGHSGDDVDRQAIGRRHVHRDKLDFCLHQL